MPGRVRDGEAGRERRLTDGRQKHEPTPLHPVGQRAADRRQHPDREEGGGGDEPDPPGLVGDLGDEHPDRDGLHPRAHVGHERRTPHQRELPVAERTEGREARLGLSGRVGGVFRDRQTGSSRSSR